MKSPGEATSPLLETALGLKSPGDATPQLLETAFGLSEIESYLRGAANILRGPVDQADFVGLTPAFVNARR